MGQARRLVILALGLMAAGCSFGGSVATAPSPAPPPDPAPTASAPTLGQRMGGLFSPSAPPPSAAPGAFPAATADVQCPGVEIRQGASTMSFSATGNDPASAGLRYQVTISRTARECLVRGDMLTIRIGVEGRVILGPVGGPGQVEVPVRYALVLEGPEPRTITTKLHRVPVVIGPGQGNLPFSHVEDDLTVPMPSSGDLDNYVIYVGFDPNVPPEDKKKKPKGKPKPQRPA